MSQTNTSISSNFIGEFFGVTNVSYSESRLFLKGSWKKDRYIDLSLCTRFPTFQKHWLGGRISFYIAGREHTIRYLKSEAAEVFINQFHQAIAQQIERNALKKTRLFAAWVIREYPRGSRFQEIERLSSDLYACTRDQIQLWKQHTSSGLMLTIEEALSLYPCTMEKLQQYHEGVQLKKRELFFDSVESNKLTLDQRLGVLRSNDINMVLAAAGTGKTSVMVAKALDIIDRGLAKPEEILILAYNKAAATELKVRLADKAIRSDIQLITQPSISTFHALGRTLLREAGITTYMSVFTEDSTKFQQWVTSWLINYLSTDVSRLAVFLSLIPEPTNPFDFKTKAEYEAYVRDNEFRTLSNEEVKGYQELLIANYLHLNGIAYTYEAPYVSKRRIEIGFDYRPDFHIDDTTIYIEHFGIDRKGNTRADIDSIAYNEDMVKKRELHNEFETTLVETFHYEWCEETLLSGLETQLENLGIKRAPINPEEILAKLQEADVVSDWSKMLLKALQAIRVERLDKDKMLARFIDAKISQPKKHAEVFDSLHKAYIQELEEQNCIDFDDMIIRSSKIITSRQFVPKWTYVLVDEFQDISSARMELVNSIVKYGPTPSLTVVGDDWQSIYRFSGGKLELTTRFGELVGDYTATLLKKTFRYNNSIADTAGQFIMENPEQYEKHIETHTKVKQSQIHLLDDKIGIADGLYQRVKEVVEKIKANDADPTIAVIARYNYLLSDSKDYLTQHGLQRNVKFWSFHGSKGLEADYVILIGFSQGKLGFPNDNKDQQVIEALLPTLDSFPYSEERRLFYVGLTRAKKKCYIIADPTSPSSFITEILAPKYKISIHSPTFQRLHRQIFKCPNCEEGYLKLISGQYGNFYSCSTRAGCKVGKARVCTECGAPSIDSRTSSNCNNHACNHTFRICDKCGRPMKKRKGAFGEFWGCSGYGIKDDQCRNKAKT